MDITEVKGQKLYYVVQEPIDINLVKSTEWNMETR
jgi:hypothetical protein